MNGWDAFTWFCSAALAGAAVVIFAYFLRDARTILSRDTHDHEEPSAGTELE